MIHSVDRIDIRSSEPPVIAFSTGKEWKSGRAPMYNYLQSVNNILRRIGLTHLRP